MGVDIATLGIKIDSSQVSRGAKELDSLERSGAKAEKSTQGLTRATDKLGAAVKTAAIAFATYKLAAYVKESATLAARYETLGVVLENVGRNAGLSGVQVDGLAQALQSTGISMIESRQSVARMIQANLDLTRATDLARVAQDAAVIGNINSSEAFQRLVRGIQTAEVETLRNIGIVVSFEKSYKDFAKTIGVAAGSLTENQKATARMNAVLEAGTRISGTYTAAMETAGKKLSSLERYAENAQVQLGLMFQPAFIAGVDAATEALKYFTYGLKQLNDSFTVNEKIARTAAEIKNLENAISEIEQNSFSLFGWNPELDGAFGFEGKRAQLERMNQELAKLKGQAAGAAAEMAKIGATQKSGQTEDAAKEAKAYWVSAEEMMKRAAKSQAEASANRRGIGKNDGGLSDAIKILEQEAKRVKDLDDQYNDLRKTMNGLRTDDRSGVDALLSSIELQKEANGNYVAGRLAGIEKVQDSMLSSYDFMEMQTVATAQAMGDAFGEFFFDATTGRLESLADYVQSFAVAVNRTIMNALGQQAAGALTSFAGDYFAPKGLDLANTSTVRGYDASGSWTGSTIARAGGGWIDEPVVGIGMNSGKRWTFGENEAEMVVPKSKMGGGGSGGTTVVQNFNLSPGVPEAVQREVKRAMPYIQAQTIRSLDERNQRGRRK